MATTTGERMRLVALALSMVLCAAAASAADVSLVAEVESADVALDEPVLLRVRLEAPEAPSRWEFPDTPDFKVLVEAPSHEQSISIGGGGLVIRHIFTITRQLQATRTGSLTIPRITAVVRGRSYAAGPIVVRVRGAGTAPPAGPAPGAQAGNPGYRGWEKDLTLQAEVDRKEVYVGEQLTVAFWLYTRAEEMVCDTSPPRYEGFWKEDLEVPGRFQPEDRMVNGIPTHAYLIQRVALFPTRPGDLTIDPMELPHIQLRLGSRGVFSGFDDVVNASRKSAPVTIHVKPLPPGAPGGFEPPNVGALTLAAEAAPTRARVGEPVTVRVSVSGDGNARALSPPNLPAFPGVRAFQPVTRNAIEQRSRRAFGTKIVDTVLVPEREGELVIAPVEWPYFDPHTGKYQVARTAELKVAVLPAGPAALPTAPGSNPLEARIRPIRSQATLTRRGPPGWERTWFLALLLGLPLASLSVAAVERLRAHGDATRARRTAARSARKRIAAARRRLARGDPAGAFAELEHGLLGYASDRLGRPAAGLTREELAVELARAGAHPPATRALLRALDLVDSSRYGAGGGGGDEPLRVTERAIEALEEADWQPDMEVVT
jgi:hypothetical protein